MIVKSGVYQITNTINNNFYIGSAKNIHTRILGHKWLLKNNQHHNRHLQSAVNKYGICNFTFKELAYCPNEYLRKLEQWFIDTLKPKYNILLIVGTSKGLKHPKSFFDKMNKKILQYDLNGVFIKEWKSTKEASIVLGLNRHNISGCLNNKFNQASGFIWKFKTKGYKKFIVLNKPITINNQHCIKAILKINNDGSIEEFESMTICSKHIGITKGHISNILAGRNPQNKNFKLQLK